MKKNILVVFTVMCTVGMTEGQFGRGQIDISKIPLPVPHYQSEYTYDMTTDTLAWIAQKPGLNAAFGSTDELYLRCEVPQLQDEGQIREETGWRGERINAQILVWSSDTIR